jgi:hypothetical protein
MDEDPLFYKKKTIRINSANYFRFKSHAGFLGCSCFKSFKSTKRTGNYQKKSDDIPEAILKTKISLFYRLRISNENISAEAAVPLQLKIHIEEVHIVDWYTKPDIIRKNDMWGIFD